MFETYFEKFQAERCNQKEALNGKVLNTQI